MKFVTLLGIRGYKIPQLHEYFDQNWSVDHKNTRNHYNQAAEAVITKNSLRDIFSGTPCSTTCSKNQIRHNEALLERGWCTPTFVRIQIVEASPSFLGHFFPDSVRRPISW